MQDKRTGSDRAEAAAGDIQSFGRRRARVLSPRQRSLIAAHREPRRALQDNGEIAPGLTAAIADTERPVWLEIGFGGGEHLIWQARENPGVCLVGSEPFLDGFAKAITGIDTFALANVLLHDDDVRPLLRAMPKASIDRAFILFPDPWPKKRHHKRRLVARPLLDQLGRVMRPGAELRVATDIADYARAILLAALEHAEFAWDAAGPDDWRVRPNDWPPTRYEAKADRQGRPSSYFRFRRR
ncbi:MAG: tRNA (guanine(46)-N(7))-methyltransferase TrmB [Pseudomonadota bacterium]